MVSNLPPGRSPRPAGMAQLGYACFWPNGGGRIEGSISSNNSQHLGTTSTPPSPEGQQEAEDGKHVEEVDGNGDPIAFDATAADEAAVMMAPHSS
jgi:hypothetical protein